METYSDSTNVYGGTPRAIRIVLCNDHGYFTPVGTCGHDGTNTVTRYGVIGTDYGKLHNAAGDWRLWASASSSYRAARELRGAA